MKVRSSVKKIEKKNITSPQQNFQIIEYGFLVQKQKPIPESQMIPNSQYIDSTTLETGPEWMLKQIKEIDQILKCYGLKKNIPVLVYNRYFQVKFLLPACRLAVILLQLQFLEVNILADGLQGYLNKNQDDFLEIYAFKNQQGSIKDKLIHIYKQNQTKILIEKQDVQKLVKKNQIQLIDTRSRDQYQGLISGYSYMDRKGRIQKSKYPYFEIKQNLKLSEIFDFLKTGNFIKEWTRSGVDIGNKYAKSLKKIVLYCGNGWRASQAWVFLHLNGVDHTAIYSNGWMQWSRDGTDCLIQNN